MKQQTAFCENCGKKVFSENSSFCENCGRPLVSDSQDSTDQVEVQHFGTKRTGRGNFLEIWRRLFLALSACAAVWLIFYASLSPLLAVNSVDFAEEKIELAHGYLGTGILTDEEKQLSSLPLEKYIAEVTKGKLTTVEGVQWETFFSKVAGTLNGTVSEREWERRLGDEYSTNVYFDYNEAPLSGVIGSLSGVSELYLTLGGKVPVKYLRVEVKKYSNDDFHLGYGVNGPPAFLLYPYRQYGFWLALIGLAIYILLPWPKKRSGVICYQRWRVVLGDFLALLLLVMFYSVPFFVVGDSVQAIVEYWPFVLIMWLLASIAILLFKITAWHAAHQIEILSDRLCRVTYKMREEYLFTAMDYIQPAVLVPPRWLIITSWLAALSGKTPLATGNALILSNSEYGGIRIVNKDGSLINIWYTDQLGNIALPGYKSIQEALKNAGVAVKREPIRIVGLGLE